MTHIVLLIGAFWFVAIGAFLLGYYFGRRCVELDWLDSLAERYDEPLSGGLEPLLRSLRENVKRETMTVH